MPPSSKFWDRIADRYARKPVGDEAAYQKKLQVTRGYFRPDMEVFEFGCGTGSTAIAHAPHVKHIRAVDISSRMIEIAKGKAEADGVENVTFETAAIDGLDQPSERYEAVMAHSILHLLEDREPVIAAVHRMLKPGGIFVSSTACLGDSQKHFMPIVLIGKLFGFLPLVRFFTRKELERSLLDAGFRIDHLWQAGKGKSVFIVAQKAA